MRVSSRRRWLIGFLVVAVVASGAPSVLAQDAAQHSAARWGQLARAAVPETDAPARLRAPPDADERRLLGVAPSGANPPYPPNHTLDAERTVVGTPPANNDFEAPASATGAPPTNGDLAAAAQDVGTPPANFDVASGDLSSWTTTGTVAAATDATHGAYASLGASGTLTTAAFTVDAAAQSFVFDYGTLAASGYNQATVSILTGADYATSASLASYTCSNCGAIWTAKFLDATPYRGQSVKLKFARANGSIGIDNVRTQIIVPDMATAGLVGRGADADGNAFATLDAGGVLTTAAFTVAADAQSGSLRARSVSGTNGQFYAYVLSGADFATSTQVAVSSGAPATWTLFSFNVVQWRGQQIKLKVTRQYSQVAVDDLGAQAVAVPSWDVTKDAWQEAGGPSGGYVSMNGNLTSQPFTLATNIQQLGLDYKGGPTLSIFYVKLLRGPAFDQVVDLHGGSITADPAAWKTLKLGIALYAGETVKLRIEQYWGRGLYDNLAVGEVVLPGWTPTDTHAIATGEDAHGSYVHAFDRSAAYLRSGDIATGIVDTPTSVEQRYYAISYDIGYTTGELVRVTWFNRATGQNWVVFTDAANSPTGYRTSYFWLADFTGTDGYFVVQVPEKGKLYSIADNIARQQLAEPFSNTVGHGIDTSTGSFGYQEQDLSVQGTLPLTLTRYYAGQADTYGALGYRWSHTYDMRLVTAANGDAGVIFGSGAAEFFKWNSNASAFAPADPRVHDALVKNADGTYTFTTTSNLAYHFLADGRLDSITDLHGNAVTLAYDAGNRLTTVTAPGGAALTFAYDASGRLGSVTDPVGAVVTYAYDANGDLTTVTDPVGKARTYAYSRHRLTSATDPAGQVVFANTLDGLNRVTAQTDGAGQTITLAYDAPAKGATTVTDANGHTATYYFDRFGRTTDKVDPDGRQVSYAYDGVGNLQKVIDRSAEQWQFAFDASGLPTGYTDPTGHPTSIAYTAQHLPAAVTDARGNTTSYTYDAAGNVLTKTDPLTHVWTYTYDDAGHLLTETDPLSHTTTYTYDAHGNRLTKTDPLNHTWSWTYDAAGRVVTETDPLNNTTTYGYNVAGDLESATDPLGHQTLYYRDLYGNLEAQQDALGNAILWDYDARALIVAVTDQAGKVITYGHDDAGNTTSMTDPLGHVTSWTYDALNRVVSETDALNHVIAYTYDDAGRLATETDPLNRVISYDYDSAGRLTSKTLPNGGIYTYAYDPNGNLLAETDPLAHATTYTYDAVNRLTTRTDPLGTTTSYAYDAVGQLLTITDPLNHATSYAYDAAGRLVSVTDPLGNVTIYGYDAANHRTSLTNPLNQTTTYTYDAAGRLTSVTDPLGHATTYGYDAVGHRARVTRASGSHTDYAFDPRGLLLSVTDPLLHATIYAYDDAGRRVSATDPLNHATTYAYDAANRLTGMTDALGGTVSYAYDATGQQTAVTNARGKTTTYDYDALGNLLTETDPLNRARTSTYDLAGRLTGTGDPRGTSVGYAYDAADRLTTTTYPSGSVTYAYDDAGRQVSMTDPTGVTTYGYDAAGRTTSVAAPQGTVGYAYDDAGRRVSMTLPGSQTASYAYDAAGRLTSATDPYARVTTYAYDVNNKRTGINRPNGVTTTFGYDAAGRLTALDHAGAGVGSLQSDAYTYDAANNRTSTTTAAGTETYTLDDLNRLTTVAYANGDTAGYTYDANGNRLTQTVNGATVATYAYDDADQLTSDGTQTYAYDDNGNLTAAGADAFTWDWADRLASATVSGATTTYAYDGDGTRVAKTTGGATTDYVWDRAGGLPQLASDGATTYLQAGGATEELDAAGDPRYDLADALGSTRGVTDGAGALIGTTDYDAFGAVRAQTGAQSALAYTGEQRDAETGFTYLRARYADPATGRFLSADSVQPNAPGTQGYNRYAYAANNPTTWTDPSGHEAANPAMSASALPVLAPVLRAAWFAIGRALGLEFAAEACAAAPLGCAAVAVFVIVVFIIVACVLDVFGPCWEAQRVGTQTKEQPEPAPGPTPDPDPKRELPGPPWTHPTPDPDDNPCDGLNSDTIQPLLEEGVATGAETDWGRAHIEMEHDSSAKNTKGHFLPGGTEQSALEQLLQEAMALGGSWYPSADRATGETNCVLDETFPHPIGTREGRRPDQRRDATRLRIVTRSTPPYSVITMFPR